MLRMLVVFAHPDDEGLIAGTLAYYARSGARITLACTTKGEAGEISDPALATTENLGAVREAELRCACDVMGINDLRLLGYCDSGMEGTEENRLVTAFIQADPNEVRAKLVHIIREVKPHIIITFEPGGWYGHPDHIATGRYTNEAFLLAADSSAYPETGPAWQAERLFHAVLIRDSFKVVLDYAREQGWDITEFDANGFDGPDPLAGQVTHVIDVADSLPIKQASMACHRTQFGPDHLFQKLPAEIARAAMRYEHFIQFYPHLDLPVSVEGKLTAGLLIG